MRINKLKFSNLNSLKGEFEIDFNDKELIEDNIFAIIGDTGSGKSSILDAITLALFASTARIDKITGSSNEIMNRECGSCYSEVFFTNDKIEYSALFSQRKAHNKKDGNLVMYTRLLRDITNKKTIANNKDFDRELMNIINLTFDQFSRSVLLAQGDFNKFLIAKDDDKAKILEQITGTEIYSEIGKKIYEHFANEKKQLELIDERLNTQNVLSNEEKEELDNLINENEQLIKKLIRDRENNNKIINYYEKKASLDEKRNSLNLDIEKRNQEALLYSDYRKKIEKFEETKEPLQILKLIEESKLKKNNLDKDINELTKKLETIKDDIQLKTTQLGEKDEFLKTKKTEEEELNKIVSLVRALDISISQDRFEVENLYKQKEKCISDIKNLSETNQISTQKVSAVETIIRDSSSYLENHTTHKILSQNYSEIVTNNHTLQANIKRDKNLDVVIEKLKNEKIDLISSCEKLDKEKELNQIAISKFKSEKELEDNIYTLKESLISFNRKNIELLKLSTQLEQYNRDNSDLDNFQNKLCDREIDKETIRVQLLEQNTLLESATKALERGKELLKLSAFAHTLIESEPCPLCGSLNHPNPISFDDDILSKEEKELSIIKTRVKDLESEKNKIDSQILAVNDNIKRLNSSIEINKKNLLTFLDEKISFDESYDMIKSQNDKNIEKTEREIKSFEKDAKQLSDLLNKAKLLNEKSNNLDSLIYQTTEKIDEYNTEKIEITNQNKIINDYFRSFEEFKNIDNNTLKQYKNSYDYNFNTVEKQKIELQSLKNQIEINIKSIKKIEIEQFHFEEKLGVLEKKLKENELKRYDLFGDKNCDDEISRISKIVNNLLEDISKLKDTISSLSNQKSSIESTIKSLNKNLEDESNLLISREETLNKLLIETGFISIETLYNSVLKDDEYSRYKEFVNHFESLVDKINILEQSIDTDEKNLNKMEPEISNDEALSLKAKIDVDYDRLQQEKGNYQEKIENDKRNIAKLGSIKAEREKQNIIFSQWSKLNAAIGSSDGKKFRGLAQGITLDYLLNNANNKLGSLSDRYTLIRDSENSSSNLDICVVDLYMNGIIRSVKNLSGGEKFLVSLSLALGLSELVNSKNPTQTLFLDEGFGTLDEETLENALNTLMLLSEKENKLIGIISHVEKVKQSISHQIIVNRNGNGSSSISGPGVYSK